MKHSSKATIGYLLGLFLLVSPVLFPYSKAAELSNTSSFNNSYPSVFYTGKNSGPEGTILSLTAATNVKGNISFSVSNGSGMAFVEGTTLNLVKAGTVNVTVTVTDSLDQIIAGINKLIIITPKVIKFIEDIQTPVKYWGTGPYKGAIFNMEIITKENHNYFNVILTGQLAYEGNLYLFDKDENLIQLINPSNSKSGIVEFKVPFEQLALGDYIIGVQSNEGGVRKRIRLTAVTTTNVHNLSVIE